MLNNNPRSTVPVPAALGGSQSFTGADIQPIFYLPNATGQVVPKVVGSLASITVSAVREVSPQYVMGSADFKSVSRGKRSVSGTMTFTIFDRDPFVRDIVASDQLKALENQYAGLMNLVQEANKNEYDNWLGASIDQARLEQAIKATTSLRNIIGKQPLRYADQLAPFDITISMANDQGGAAVAAVRQVYIVSQGVGWSAHDMETDMVYSYIARWFEPLTPVADRIANMADLFAPNATHMTMSDFGM